MDSLRYDYGQEITTDASDVSCDLMHVAKHSIAAADATAVSDTAVMALTVLGAEAASVTAGLTSPNIPRNVSVDGSASNIVGNVKVYGTDYNGTAITETIALNGVTTSPGSLAFKTVTKVDLPARTNSPAKQKATITVTAGASAGGTSVYTFTSAATGDPYDIDCAYLAGDNEAAEAADKLRAALNADEGFAAYWIAAGTGADITIERLTYAAHDSTINLVLKTAGDSNVTLGSITANTVTGVAEDKVSVGVGKKFGLKYALAADELVFVKLFDKSADNGTVTVDAADLSKNVFEVSGTPNGAKAIDLYIIV
jgi:hypothetical protein